MQAKVAKKNIFFYKFDKLNMHVKRRLRKRGSIVPFIFCSDFVRIKTNKCINFRFVSTFAEFLPKMLAFGLVCNESSDIINT